MSIDKAAWRALIQRNIAREGHHMTTVNAGATPRFTYTLGLWPKHSELCFAGHAFCGAADVGRVINVVANADRDAAVDVAGFGVVTFRPVLMDWVKAHLLGISDHHAGADVLVHQIVPPAG